MRTASTSIPHWIDAPLDPPLPPDSPIRARWGAVRNCLPPLAELLDVEIVLMSAEGYCVGGTGTYRGASAARCPRTPRSRTACGAGRARWSCRRARMRSAVLSGPGACTDMANFTGPVPEGGTVAVVAQIVAFTDDRRMELLMKAEKASRSAGWPGSRGRVRAGWKPCRSTLRQPFPRHHRGKRSDAPPQGFHPESGGTRKGKRRRRANRASALPRSAAAWDSLGCSPESGGNPDGRTYTRVEGNARAA